MYQALYRKYRPMVFSDVVGQEHITFTLKSQIANNKTAHAYLFTGTRGTGKTTCAKILAKAVNCEHTQNGDPCNECEICRGANDASLLDIEEIDAASNNGVDSIRDIREEVAFTPAKAKKRVYIIDEVHMLSQGAFNALLKTLEEPPEHVMFILATTEVHKIPATILSRCQRFDFKRIPDNIISHRIEYILKLENIEYDADAAKLIARLGDGSMRDALSILEMCLTEGKRLTVSDVNEKAGVSDYKYIYSIISDIADENFTACYSDFLKLYTRSLDLTVFCHDLISKFKNCMIAKSVSDLSVLNADNAELALIRDISAKFELSDIILILNILQNTLDKLYKSVDKKNEIELCLVMLCSKEMRSTRQPIGQTDVSFSSKKNNDIKEKAKKETVNQKIAADKKRLESDIPAENKQTTSGKDKTPYKKWGSVLDMVKTSGDMIIHSFLMQSKAAVQDDTIYITVKNSLAFDILSNKEKSRLINTVINDIEQKNYKIIFEKAKKDDIISDDPIDSLLDN